VLFDRWKILSAFIENQRQRRFWRKARQDIHATHRDASLALWELLALCRRMAYATGIEYVIREARKSVTRIHLRIRLLRIIIASADCCRRPDTIIDHVIVWFINPPHTRSGRSAKSTHG